MSEWIATREVLAPAALSVHDQDFSLPTGFSAFTFLMYSDDAGNGTADDVVTVCAFEIGEGDGGNDEFIFHDPPGGPLDRNVNADTVHVQTITDQVRGVRLRSTMGATPPANRFMIELWGVRIN